MKHDVRTRTLLIEAHSVIANESRRAVSRIGVPLRMKPRPIDSTELDRVFNKPGLGAALATSLSQMTLNYPPESRPLTPAEERALQAFKLSRVQQSALRKLMAEACAATMFHFFCLMDAVGHPYAVQTKRWYGASFAERREGPMLHDEFGDLYWEYKRATSRAQAPERKRGKQGGFVKQTQLVGRRTTTRRGSSKSPPPNPGLQQTPPSPSLGRRS